LLLLPTSLVAKDNNTSQKVKSQKEIFIYTARTANGYRWTYSHALKKSILIPDANKVMLFWGESFKLN